MAGRGIEGGRDGLQQEPTERDRASVALFLRSEGLERPSLLEVTNHFGAESLFREARERAVQVKNLFKQVEQQSVDSQFDNETLANARTYAVRRMLVDPVYIMAEEYWRKKDFPFDARMPLIPVLPDDFWPPYETRRVEDLENDPLNLKNMFALYESEDRVEQEERPQVHILVGHDKNKYVVTHGDVQDEIYLGARSHVPKREGQNSVNENACELLVYLVGMQQVWVKRADLYTYFGRLSPQTSPSQIRSLIKDAANRLHHRLQINNKYIVNLEGYSVGIFNFDVTVDLEPPPEK